MTAETKPSNKWALTPELKKRIEEIRNGIEEDDKEFENSTQICPVHSLPGTFSRYQGYYTRGFALFNCPKGHEFQVG